MSSRASVLPQKIESRHVHFANVEDPSVHRQAAPQSGVIATDRAAVEAQVPRLVIDRSTPLAGRVPVHQTVVQMSARIFVKFMAPPATSARLSAMTPRVRIRDDAPAFMPPPDLAAAFDSNRQSKNRAVENAQFTPRPSSARFELTRHRFRVALAPVEGHRPAEFGAVLDENTVVDLIAESHFVHVDRPAREPGVIPSKLAEIELHAHVAGRDGAARSGPGDVVQKRARHAIDPALRIITAPPRRSAMLSSNRHRSNRSVPKV